MGERTIGFDVPPCDYNDLRFALVFLLRGARIIVRHQYDADAIADSLEITMDPSTVNKSSPKRSIGFRPKKGFNTLHFTRDILDEAKKQGIIEDWVPWEPEEDGEDGEGVMVTYWGPGLPLKSAPFWMPAEDWGRVHDNGPIEQLD